MLEAVKVDKWYHGGSGPALSGLTLSISRGEILSLVGLNGAGKTTSIRIMTGVILPTRGSIVIDGYSMAEAKRSASRLVGWVPETPNHDSGLSLQRILDFYCRMTTEIPSVDRTELLEQWGLGSMRNRKFGTLSLGERKRFALAVAGIHSPSYYLLDEVLNGLDPEGVSEVRKWMLEKRGSECGFLLSSHQLREVQSLSDRIAFLHAGRLLTVIEPSQIPPASTTRIRLLFAPTDDRAVELLSRFGTVEQSPGGAYLTGKNISSGEVNRALFEGGYEVSRIEPTEPDLEPFFLDLVRKAK